MISRTTFSENGYDSFTVDMGLFVVTHLRYQSSRWVMGIPVLGAYVVLSNDLGGWRVAVQRMAGRPFRDWLIVQPPQDRLMRILRVGKVCVDLIASNECVVAKAQAALSALHPLARKLAVWEIQTVSPAAAAFHVFSLL